MKAVRTPVPKETSKAPTGIAGFDEITGGGLPRGSTTLLVGGPGSGKTLLSLEFLVHGAIDRREPGIFVAFEEGSSRITSNAASFGWDLARLQPKMLFFLDAKAPPELVLSGSFDLGGMLAALGVKIKEMGARRIVFDALDVLLDLLPDHEAKKREIYRLHEWLLARDVTGIITAKSAGDEPKDLSREPLGSMQFMVDCTVILRHTVEMGVSQRNLRVQKYRGSSFDENESPFMIGKAGFEVGVARTVSRVDGKVTHERVSSGVARLDTMLGGGYYRGACVLITGFPGSAKTTLTAAFAEAACARGERTLFVSFDTDGPELIRNLESVGIRLQRFIKSGMLSMISARNFIGGAGAHLVRIKMLALEHRARCLAIDPVSTLVKSAVELNAHSVAELLIDWAKAEHITMMCTSEQKETSTGSPLHISTLADTWMELTYFAQGGERNRGISIIKSRGSAHSNQVRELLLSEKGLTLSDVYSSGGEVLMGAARFEKETAARAAQEVVELSHTLRRLRLEADEAELLSRMRAIEAELIAKQMEKDLLDRAAKTREEETVQGGNRLQELRGADSTIMVRE